MAIPRLMVGASERRRFCDLASLDAVLCRLSQQPAGRSSLYSAGTDAGSAAGLSPCPTRGNGRAAQACTPQSRRG